MTIEQALADFIDSRIAAYMQGGQAQQAPAPVAVPQIPTVAPPVVTYPAPQAPLPITTPAQASPPPGPPVAPVGGPPPVGAPPQPASPPVTAVPTLDEIRALANDFARANPARIAEFQAFIESKGAHSLPEVPATEYVACKAELQRLMGVA